GDGGGRGVLGHEAGRGEGQGLDHALGDLNAQGATLRLSHRGGEGKAKAGKAKREAERADRCHGLFFPSGAVLAGAVTAEKVRGQRRGRHCGSFGADERPASAARKGSQGCAPAAVTSSSSSRG